jgi:DNA polymerase III alpha subunit
VDIDIDLKTSFNPKDIFSVTNASMVASGELKKHPCGVYFQSIPKDPVTGLSAIPYKDAERYGFMKIDFLHLKILDYFNDKNEIRKLIKKKPKWGLLMKSNVVSNIFQLSNNLDILRKIKPKSIQEIADCIAIIRPGKIHLLDSYLINPINTRQELYNVKKGTYSYKKGHAISYSMIVVLQLHLIENGTIEI